jgi:tetratricopeptide (TPR) repeat protein
MKHYYYANNDQQFGPFTIDELKTKRLKKSVLVWTDGMEEWASAQSIEELKDILISEPPPLPKSSNPQPIDTSQNEKVPIPNAFLVNDLTYEKEYEATFVGVLLLAIPIILKIKGSMMFNTDDSYKFFLIASIILRIIITAWVVKIAYRQNRNTTIWGFFAFLLPSISLIIIGQLNKLSLKIVIDGSLPTNQQVENLLDKANEFYNNFRYSEAIEILDKALKIDNQNYACIKLHFQAINKLKNYDKFNNDFEVQYDYDQLIADEQKEWIEDPDLCSGCGYEGVLNKSECPYCGLNLE